MHRDDPDQPAMTSRSTPVTSLSGRPSRLTAVGFALVAGCGGGLPSHMEHRRRACEEGRDATACDYLAQDLHRDETLRPLAVPFAARACELDEHVCYSFGDSTWSGGRPDVGFVRRIAEVACARPVFKLFADRDDCLARFREADALARLHEAELQKRPKARAIGETLCRQGWVDGCNLVAQLDAADARDLDRARAAAAAEQARLARTRRVEEAEAACRREQDERACARAHLFAAGQDPDENPTAFEALLAKLRRFRR